MKNTIFKLNNETLYHLIAAHSFPPQEDGTENEIRNFLADLNDTEEPDDESVPIAIISDFCNLDPNNYNTDGVDITKMLSLLQTLNPEITQDELHFS